MKKIYGPLQMGPIGFPETSVRNYQHSQRNDPEEHIYHLLRGGSQKSLPGFSFNFQWGYILYPYTLCDFTLKRAQFSKAEFN